MIIIDKVDNDIVMDDLNTTINNLTVEDSEEDDTFEDLQRSESNKIINFLKIINYSYIYFQFKIFIIINILRVKVIQN